MSKIKWLTPSFFRLSKEQLPEGWITRNIDSICKLHQGGKLKFTKEIDYRSYGYPAFSAAGQDGFVLKAEFQDVNAVILSAIGANCGRCFFAEGDWTTLANVQAIIPNEKEINAKYLYYRVNRDDFWIKSGSAQPFIKPQSIKRAWISFPKNILVQKKIATILTTIDTAIEKTQQLIDKYRKIKTGMMNDLFTRGIGSNGKLRPPRSEAPELYKKTELGWIPTEWEVKIVDDLFYVQLGKMLSRVSKTGKFEFPYLGNKNIQWESVDLCHLETMDFKPEERLKFRLEKDDLLTCEGGDVGRTAIWNNELSNCYYQKAVHRLRSKKNELLPLIMLRYMKFAKENNLLMNYTSQTSIAHLTREKLIKLSVPVQRPEEQKIISSRFEAIDGLLKHESEKLGKLQKQKAGLMQDLLTGKVEVTVPEKEVGNV